MTGKRWLKPFELFVYPLILGNKLKTPDASTAQEYLECGYAHANR